MSSRPIVSLQQVTKTYVMGEVTLDALHNISFDVHEGEYIAIMGPSGCGKSTLLNILGCLDRPSKGKYLLGGRDVSHFDDNALSEMRGSQLGFIFQSYNLIQQLDVLENIEVPLYYQGVPAGESRRLATEIAKRVGLGARLHHKPTELSGGQQQRVGIARALVNNPLVLLADEPTGNLDSSSGAEILALFDELRAQKKTIIMVTHDPDIGLRSDRIIRLRDGCIEEDVRNA
ncbi:MAG TPA: ABC transporter ATP-binding protein [Candidatus Hydrogenedentes bacterium]|jgi:putative ABC transport system ATP-binding protein|nr:MAG: Macrolide export ATP-binding/permease protein MacB [Candidatus Hydrogenedentes bacterium ADurb.Bin170]HNZ48843.1 ABC transporter ATP-binding protein [Candidatus Hydrogenedentota bacterium]HOD95938.1 ABC transporter ATP-binding protein [Candidatus Hydrogenedentota bacterium]HOM47503.1 ABC transporter ATP-binding protein [Candidatus Hydrogenedentota bacterium]HOR51342.1 ABC transporter ATP-binding protein [Candidatus Hydrogenedentota bacterium]